MRKRATFASSHPSPIPQQVLGAVQVLADLHRQVQVAGQLRAAGQVVVPST